MKSRKTLWDPLNIGELVYTLAERLKSKDVPRKLYKISAENKLFLKKDQIYVMQKSMKVSDKKYFHWISKRDNKAVINNRFLSRP